VIKVALMESVSFFRTSGMKQAIEDPLSSPVDFFPIPPRVRSLTLTELIVFYKNRV
jgi:hypothetical protein